VKHSGASEVLIRLIVQETRFELAIEDNGRGFAADETTAEISSVPGRVASGNGLENMKRRLAGIGGVCKVHSVPQAGTKVIFSVPLNASDLPKTHR
jgi:signal transduction histidine kinase